MAEEGTAARDRWEGGREGRRKQINTGEQEGPANERTDAKSSADQRRDASQSSLFPVSSLLFYSVALRIQRQGSLLFDERGSSGSSLESRQSR